MCRYNVSCVNEYLYEHDYGFYYHIAKRNGHKALDKYERCPDCMVSGQKNCDKDRLLDNVGNYTTGELYEVTRAMRDMVAHMS